jgi:hypothetical protein
MSHYRHSITLGLIAVACLGLGALDIIGGRGARAEDARETPTRPPPGVLIEPRRGAHDREDDSDTTRDDEHRPDLRPGCPANDRKLELIA